MARRTSKAVHCLAVFLTIEQIRHLFKTLNVSELFQSWLRQLFAQRRPQAEEVMPADRNPVR